MFILSFLNPTTNQYQYGLYIHTHKNKYIKKVQQYILKKKILKNCDKYLNIPDRKFHNQHQNKYLIKIRQKQKEKKKQQPTSNRKFFSHEQTIETIKYDRQPKRKD